LRDATGLIRFTDFVNQIQFADAANDLNQRVLTEVLAGVDAQKLKGKTISLAGTFSLDGDGEPKIRGVIPVSLAVEDHL
jgi:predicted lipoprotein